MSLGGVISVARIKRFAMHLIFVYIAAGSFSRSSVSMIPLLFFFFFLIFIFIFNMDKQVMLIPTISQLQDPTHHPIVSNSPSEHQHEESRASTDLQKGSRADLQDLLRSQTPSH